MFTLKFVLLLNYYRRIEAMYKDEIIDEVWKNREAYIKRYHHDINEIISDLKKRQEHSNRVVIDRRLTPNQHTKKA